MATRVRVSGHTRTIPKQRTKVKAYIRTIDGKGKKKRKVGIFA